MISRLIQSISSYGDDIDFLFDGTAAVVFFFGLITEIFLFAFIWVFREREGVPSKYVTGGEPELKRWINWPHYIIIFCDIFIILGAVNVWYEVKQDVPDTAEQTIRIVSQQWAWSFVHPGADGELDTPDDIRTVDELHIEVDKAYRYELLSRDVLHSFSVPVFRLKQDAVPGRIIRGWFDSDTTGQFDIQCAEMCGIGHGIMAAQLFIETPEEHAAWIASATPAQQVSQAR